MNLSNTSILFDAGIERGNSYLNAQRFLIGRLIFEFRTNRGDGRLLFVCLALAYPQECFRRMVCIGGGTPERPREKERANLFEKREKYYLDI